MADPVGFDGANTVFRAPPGSTPEEYKDLQTYHGQGQIISCWRLTPEELEVVNRTGVIWVSMLTHAAPPPLLVCGTGMFQGGDPKAEPFVAPARRAPDEPQRDTRATIGFRVENRALLRTCVRDFMSTRCNVSSQHKLPSREEILSAPCFSAFGATALAQALDGLIDDGTFHVYGPYISDHEIDVL